MDLESAFGWSELTYNGHRGSNDWFFKRSPFSEGSDSILLAIDNHGCRHLLIGVSPSFEHAKSDSILASSVSSFTVEFPNEGVISDHFLDIWCRDDTLHDEFNQVVISIIEATRSDSDASIDAVVELAKWRRLLRSIKSVNSLSFKQQVALFGELSFIEQLAEQFGHFDPEWWTGPNAAPHDFELPTESYEIKSYTEDSDAVSIHGIQQLDSPIERNLYLVLQRVGEDEQGTTVSELLERICNKYGARAEFLSKASKANLRVGTEELVKLNLVRSDYLLIDDMVPRITSRNLDFDAQTTLKKLTYELYLEALHHLTEPFPPIELGDTN